MFKLETKTTPQIYNGCKALDMLNALDKLDEKWVRVEDILNIFNDETLSDAGCLIKLKHELSQSNPSNITILGRMPESPCRSHGETDSCYGTQAPQSTQKIGESSDIDKSKLESISKLNLQLNSGRDTLMHGYYEYGITMCGKNSFDYAIKEKDVSCPKCLKYQKVKE